MMMAMIAASIASVINNSGICPTFTSIPARW
jgi:hypothetical protein